MQDRFRGCLLGLAVGDAVGAPFEGVPGDAIFHEFGPIDKVIAAIDDDVITYTDDTQMAIGVAECLLAHASAEGNCLADRFLANYESGRGYGRGVRMILDAMVAGENWKHLVTTIFPGGSYGNGAAMRVAPVGLVFHDKANRLREVAKRSAELTHLHPLGIDAAVIVATAVSILLRDQVFDSKSFFAELEATATTEEFQWQLRTAGRLSAKEMFHFGSSLPAHRSVTTAITCFSVWPDSYAKAIGRAISMGDDTDTLAAIAGALSGAYLGVGAIPPHLLSRLENGKKGRDYIDQLAGCLYEKWLTSPDA
jgi:poly(ADP-ribose) glycohydrolase ARH3